MPIRRWRKCWPKDYDRLLEELHRRWPQGQGVREFIAVLKLHQDYPARQVEAAVRMALELGEVHLDGVQFCYGQLKADRTPLKALDLSDQPYLASFSNQPVELQQYNLLLAGRCAVKQYPLLESYLRQLRLPTFIKNYRPFAVDAARNNLDYVHYLLALTEQEIHQREQNRLLKRLKAARFPVIK